MLLRRCQYGLAFVFLVTTLNFSASWAQTLSSLVPVTPCRVVDTRGANGPFGGPELVAGATRTFAIPASSCGIPSNATAYSLNVTVVPRGPLSYLTVWPAGQPIPLASILNAPTGQITANGAIVEAGASGALSVYATNVTNLILDINGYFVSESSDSSSSLNFSDAEVPSGTLDGQNAIFTLAQTPVAAPILARNGVVQDEGTDYTLAGNIITFTAAATPQPSDLIQTWYRYSNVVISPEARRAVAVPVRRSSDRGGISPRRENEFNGGKLNAILLLACALFAGALLWKGVSATRSRLIAG